MTATGRGQLNKPGAFTDIVPQDKTVTSTSDGDGADSVQRWVEKLIRAQAAGDPLDAGDKHLPAEALRKVLVDPQLVADPRGLSIQNAHITETLGLEHIVFSHPLRLRDCTLEAPIKLAGATIKELDFAGSRMQELNLDGRPCSW